MKRDIPLVNDDELALLINELFERYGYDFTQYAKASLKRRLIRLMVNDRFPSFAEVYHRVRTDPSFLTTLVESLTVNVTEMFRDPQTFRKIREEVFPILATHPFIRIWHAGCASGEEVFSMAILLKEANLLQKSRLYATDINSTVVEKVKKGIVPLNQMKIYSENYIAAGGKKDFSEYYTARFNHAILDQSLTEKMIVSTHNLVSDRSFNEFQLILCRNVLIYFDKELQEKVLKLFDDSLEKLGFLVLGAKESLNFASISRKYRQLDRKEKIWRKIE